MRFLQIWLLGGLVSILTIGSSVLNLTLLRKVSTETHTVTYAAFASSVAAVSIVFVVLTISAVIVFTRSPIIASTSRHSLWIRLWFYAAVLVATSILEGSTLVWLSIRWGSLKDAFRLRNTGTLQAWTLLWALSLVARISFVYSISRHIPTVQDCQVLRQQALDHVRTGSPAARSIQDYRPSVSSRANTLTPRPASSLAGSSFLSSTTRVGSSLRHKLTRSSAKSSLDLSVKSPTKYARSQIESEKCDTSPIEGGLNKPYTSPLLTRLALETIPGSRAGSKSDVFDNTQSPTDHSNEQEKILTPAMSPTTKAADSKCSPTINFSRRLSATDKRTSIIVELPVSTPKPVFAKAPRLSASMQDLIHPLFRPDSPGPPPIVTPGTMVTASPRANQPITPQSLARLRSESDLRHHDTNRLDTGAAVNRRISTNSINSTSWRPNKTSGPAQIAPNRARSRSDSQSPSTPCSPTTVAADVIRTDGPGPTVYEDIEDTPAQTEYPAILPGFVLNAGSRSSLVGYGKRKSVKKEGGVNTSVAAV